MARHDPQMSIRIPLELKQWLAAEAKRNGSSQTSEVVRSVRERKDRLDQEKAA